MRPYVKLLSGDELKNIHKASLDILEKHVVEPLPIYISKYPRNIASRANDELAK